MRAFAVSNNQHRFLRLALGVAFFMLLFALVHWIIPISPRAILSPRSQFSSLGFSPDGASIVTTGSPELDWQGFSPLHVWDAQTGKERFVLAADWLRVDAFQFSSDSKFLAAGQMQGALRVWDVGTGREIVTLKPFVAKGNVLHFRFTPDSRFLAFDSTHEDLIHFWSIYKRRHVGRIQGHFANVPFSPDGQTIATVAGSEVGKTDRAFFWSLPVTAPPRCIQELRIPANQLSFSTDLSTIVAVKSDEPAEIALWDRATGKKRCSLNLDQSECFLHGAVLVNDNLLSARGMRYTSSSTEMRYWRIDRTLTPTRSFSGKVDSSTDGQWLALRHEKGARLYRVSDMDEHADLCAPDDVWASFESFSPDSRFIVTATCRGAWIRPLSTWLPTWIIDACSDHTIRLWDTETGKQQSAFYNCKNGFFSPDGKTLATVQMDDVVKLWDLPVHKPLGAVLGWTVAAWLVAIWIWRLVTAGRTATT